MIDSSRSGRWIYISVFKLISPLIRILMGAVTFPQFCEILKFAYIREAEKYISEQLNSTRITKSEISLVTGIDSRQFPNEKSFDLVSENRLFTNHEGEQGKILYPETSILGMWDAETNYLTDQYKKTKTIPIYGKQNSFESYVRKHYTRGVTIQSVLGRLISSDNIEMVCVDFVSLKSKYYLPVDGAYFDLLKIGLNHISCFASTVAHNLLHKESEHSFFQRCYQTADIRKKDFSNSARKISALLTKQIKQSETLIVEAEDGEPDTGTNFCGVGYFYFESVDKTL